MITWEFRAYEIRDGGRFLEIQQPFESRTNGAKELKPSQLRITEAEPEKPKSFLDGFWPKNFRL